VRLDSENHHQVVLEVSPRSSAVQPPSHQAMFPFLEAYATLSLSNFRYAEAASYIVYAILLIYLSYLHRESSSPIWSLATIVWHCIFQ
jgi:hypothetical protein